MFVLGNRATGRGENVFGGQPLAPLRATTLALNGPSRPSTSLLKLSPGQFPLLQYTSRTGNGNFTLGSLPTGWPRKLVTNAAKQPLIRGFSPEARRPGDALAAQEAPLMTDWASR